MTKPLFRSAAASDPGHVRGNNEDRVYCDDERGIYLVIDGVGGQAGGERAAALAETELLARLERSTGSVEDRIREGIALAGRRIFEQAQRNPELAGMACVLTVAVLAGNEAVIGHVGDTRLYKIRHGAIVKVTPDHSPVGAREDAGEISEIEAMHHPRRNEIFRDVGSGERRPDDTDFIDTLRISFESDSALLLCSDGLTDQVSSSEILDVVESHAGDPSLATRELIRRANEAGGKDNVSVVYVEGPSFAAAVKLPVEAKKERTRRAPLALGVLGGVLLGVVGTLGVLQWIHGRGTAPPRIVTVRQGGEGAFASIAEALEDARAGDTVEVMPGTYRESITLKEGVHLVSRPAGQAIIQPKPDASQAGAAVIAGNTRSASIAGFRIVGGQRNDLSIGVLIENSDIDLDGVEIAGATSAGILIRGTSQPSIRGNYIHDNYGAGVLVEDSAAPRLQANLISNNGRSPESPRGGVEVTGTARPALVSNVLVNNFRNLRWENATVAEAEARKQNVFVEPPPPRPAARRK